MSQSVRFRCVVVAVLAALVFGCNGEDSDSITGPGNVTRVNILLISPSLNALQKAKMTFDGRYVAEITSIGGTAPAIPLEATLSGVSRGPHTIRVVIVEQASSPNPYIAAGAIVTPDRVIELAPVEGNLRTGEALEIRVSF